MQNLAKQTPTTGVDDEAVPVTLGYVKQLRRECQNWRLKLVTAEKECARLRIALILAEAGVVPAKTAEGAR